MEDDYTKRIGCEVIKAHYSEEPIMEDVDAMDMVFGNNLELEGQITGYRSIVRLDVKPIMPGHPGLKRVIFRGYSHIDGGDKIYVTINPTALGRPRKVGAVETASKIEKISADGTGFKTVFE